MNFALQLSSHLVSKIMSGPPHNHLSPQPQPTPIPPDPGEIDGKMARSTGFEPVTVRLEGGSKLFKSLILRHLFFT